MSDISIMNSAFMLFALKGYEATTMREIAEGAGIKGASIYNHYTSKDDLFLKVTNDFYQRLSWENIDTETLEASKVIVDTKELLFHVFKSYYDYFSIHREDLLFWQRIRFFPPGHLIHEINLNQLLYQRKVVDIYLDIFKYAAETKQVKPDFIELNTMLFFALVSGYVDSLLIMPFRITDVELRLSFDKFWTGIVY